MRKEADRSLTPQLLSLISMSDIRSLEALTRQRMTASVSNEHVLGFHANMPCMARSHHMIPYAWNAPA